MDASSRRRALTKYYGSHRGIVDVDLAVQQGEIFGFLGPNGAGKTTTIRLLLDLIRPTSGRALVFGIETTVDPSAIHRRIGYLPGEFALYDRLTGGQTIEYFANLRGGVDPLYQADLIARFDLDPSRRFREYSRGNKQKVGLVIALQHRPELLVLDEPTAGPGPARPADVLRAPPRDGRRGPHGLPLLAHPGRGREDVRPGGDHPRGSAGQGRPGRGAARSRAPPGRAALRRPVPAADFRGLPGVSDVVADDHVLRMRVTGSMAPVVRAAARHDLLDFTSREPSLEDTFLAQYGREAVEVNNHGR